MSWTGSQSVVWFDMLPADGEWYSGMTRYYDLQVSTDLTQQAGGWTGVAGYTNMPGALRAAVYTNAPGGVPRLYRARVWLTP